MIGGSTIRDLRNVLLIKVPRDFALRAIAEADETIDECSDDMEPENDC